MNKIIKLSGTIVLGAIILSSCAKKNLTASFQNIGGGAYHTSKIKTADVAIVPENKTTVQMVENNAVDATAEASVSQNPTEITSEMKTEITKQIANLSTEQKKELKSTLQELKKSRVEKTSSKLAGSDDTLLLVLIALFIPPLAVYLLEGAITSSFWIDLILTLLGWLPGVIYALILIL